MELILGCKKPTKACPDQPYRISDDFVIVRAQKFLGFFVTEFKKLVHGMDKTATVDVVRHGDDVILRVSPDIYRQIDYGDFVTTCHRDKWSWA